MAMGRQRSAPAQALFVATSEISAAENPFYRPLNGLLGESGFDEFTEDLCQEFYAGNVGIECGVGASGRPGGADREDEGRSHALGWGARSWKRTFAHLLVTSGCGVCTSGARRRSASGC